MFSSFRPPQNQQILSEEKESVWLSWPMLSEEEAKDSGPEPHQQETLVAGLEQLE